MSTTLSTAARSVQHPPQPLQSLPARRVGLVDRLALRVGLALIVWGRRPVRASRERFVTQAELSELARLEAARQYPASMRLF